jgi:hypothetical protein
MMKSHRWKGGSAEGNVGGVGERRNTTILHAKIGQ